LSNLRRHLSFSNVISIVALFAALGGTAWALKNNSVKSKHIVNGQVKEKDLQDRYQYGNNGFDEAWANILADGEGELVFFLLFGGTLEIDCDATPTLTYTNDNGQGFPADVWQDGVHSTVDDGTSGVLDLDPTDQIQLQIWTIPVSMINLSVFRDPATSECYYAATLQENFRPTDFRKSAEAKRLKDAADAPPERRRR